MEGAGTGSSSPDAGSMIAGDRSYAANQASGSLNDSVVTGTSPVGAGTSPVAAGTSPVAAGHEIEQINEVLVSGDTDTVSLEEKHE